jgi:uncharacterized protein (TIGR02246 family)
MKRSTALVLSLFLLAGCAGRKDTKVDRARVEARLQQYSGLVLRMDSAGMAAVFAPDGELVNPRQPPVRGRAEIEKFLAGFADYKVLSNVDVATSTLIDGDAAEQLGTYRQSVRSPGGKVFEASGRLEIGWVKDAAGEWYMAQLATFPEK